MKKPRRGASHRLFGIAIALLSIAILSDRLEAQAFIDERELVIDEKFDRIVIIDIGKQRVIDQGLYAQLEDTPLMGLTGTGRLAVVIEIDSGGGEVQAAQDISSLVQRYRDDENIRIFAHVPQTAYSAAAWIAFACEGLLIAPSAQIGDIQPLTRDLIGYERAPEKIVTVLTEELVVTTWNNGLEHRYPRLFLEAMVDKDIEIVAVENPKLGTGPSYMRESDYKARTEAERRGLNPTYLGLPGKALTTHGIALLDYGFRVKIVKDRAFIQDIIGTHDVVVEEIQLKQRSRVPIDFDWPLLLVVAGLICLLMELKAPGIGIFGVMGIASFVMFFLVQSGWSNAAVWPIGIFLIGAFLVIVEVVILPGMIAPGLIGAALILYSTYIGVAHPGETGLPPWPDLDDDLDNRNVRIWATTLGGGIIVGLAFTMTFGRFIHQIPLLRQLVLRPPRGLRLDAGAASSGSTQVAATAQGTTSISVGDHGVATTDLRPSGNARFGRDRIDVVTEGGWLTQGAEVVVSLVSGNRVVVKPGSPPEKPA